MINFQGKKYLVLGTSTDIGKTFFVSQICQKLRQKNIKINAVKPLISGFDINDEKSDVAIILQSLGKKINLENIDKTTPFRLKAPFSPLKASRLENKTIDFDEIVNFCHENIKSHETLLIEGAGGVMTPINQSKTFLDLAKKLQIPVLLLSNDALGTISQTLCAITALKSQEITIESIIINDFSQKNPDIDDVLYEIEHFSKIPCFSLDNIVNRQ